MKCVLLLLLIIQWSDARVASSETEIAPNVNTNVKDKEPLHYPCKLRTLKSTDSNPSVIVRWQNKVQRVTWFLNGEVLVELYSTQPFSYPPSSGLSGDGGAATTTVKPFSDEVVIADNYTMGDIVEWFRNDCMPKNV